MKTILVVDDSMSIRQLVVETLSSVGYQVLEALDGADAITKLNELPQIELVITDINMPGMSGLDLLERLRGAPKTRNLLTVVLTSEGQSSMISRARKAGAKGWIVKPFKRELLVAAIQKMLPCPPATVRP